MAKIGKAQYATMDGRREVEKRDGEMIREDRGAMANLPDEHFCVPFSRVEFANYEVQDGMNSMDRRRSEDSKKQKDGKSVRRY
jgi:hypothetical protein